MIDGITSNLVISDFKISTNGVVYTKSNGNPGLLLIHADWCGHCKNFIPTFQDINKKLNRKSISFPCVAIDSNELDTDGGKLSSALKIQGFPTLLFFDQNGKIMGSYEGKRDVSSLLDNICKVYHHCARN